MVSTIASLIRDNGNAILALSTATKPDGGKFLHKDILLALGLPTSAAHVREVSKFLNKQGIRRRAHYTRHRDAPDGGLLPPEPEGSQDCGIYVHIEASELMDALVKVRDTCSVLQQIIQKTLDDPVYDRGRK